MDAKWETLTVDGQPMRAYVAIPDGPGPHPGLVVNQHRTGVDEFMQRIVERFAGAGYASIAPEIYHRESSEQDDEDPGSRASRLRDDGITADINAAVDYLKAHPQVDAGRLGITGFCQGGRTTYLMASVNPDLKAAAVFYGGNAMRALGDGPSPFERTKDIVCPVLGLFGAEDQNPSPEDVRSFDAEMTRWGKIHEFHTYEGVGHGFMQIHHHRGPTAKPQLAFAGEDAWAKAMEWFAKHMPEAPAPA